MKRSRDDHERGGYEPPRKKSRRHLPKVECKKCGESLTPGALSRHMLSKKCGGEDVPKHNCKCGSTFSRDDALKRHMNQVQGACKWGKKHQKEQKKLKRAKEQQAIEDASNSTCTAPQQSQGAQIPFPQYGSLSTGPMMVPQGTFNMSNGHYLGRVDGAAVHQVTAPPTFGQFSLHTVNGAGPRPSSSRIEFNQRANQTALPPPPQPFTSDGTQFAQPRHPATWRQNVPPYRPIPAATTTSGTQAAQQSWAQDQMVPHPHAPHPHTDYSAHPVPHITTSQRTAAVPLGPMPSEHFVPQPNGSTLQGPNPPPFNLPQRRPPQHTMPPQIPQYLHGMAPSLAAQAFIRPEHDPFVGYVPPQNQSSYSSLQGALSTATASPQRQEPQTVTNVPMQHRVLAPEPAIQPHSREEKSNTTPFNFQPHPPRHPTQNVLPTQNARSTMQASLPGSGTPPQMTLQDIAQQHAREAQRRQNTFLQFNPPSYPTQQNAIWDNVGQHGASLQSMLSSAGPTTFSFVNSNASSFAQNARSEQSGAQVNPHPTSSRQTASPSARVFTSETTEPSNVGKGLEQSGGQGNSRPNSSRQTASHSAGVLTCGTTEPSSIGNCLEQSDSQVNPHQNQASETTTHATGSSSYNFAENSDVGAVADHTVGPDTSSLNVDDSDGLFDFLNFLDSSSPIFRDDFYTVPVDANLDTTRRDESNGVGVGESMQELLNDDLDITGPATATASHGASGSSIPLSLSGMHADPQYRNRPDQMNPGELIFTPTSSQDPTSSTQLTPVSNMNPPHLNVSGFDPTMAATTTNAFTSDGRILTPQSQDLNLFDTFTQDHLDGILFGHSKFGDDGDPGSSGSGTAS